MTGVVLLPGAGMSSWLWYMVKDKLPVPTLTISPRIPINNKERRLDTTFDEMIEYHIKLIDSQNWDKVIVVGHSGAGLIAGTLGKRLANIAEVVFVAANIPRHQKTAIGVFPEEIQKKTIEKLTEQAEFDSIAIELMKDFFLTSFANACTAMDKDYILHQEFVPEPICVVNTRMDWSEYPNIGKTYIVCLSDRTLTREQQMMMAKNFSISNIVEMDSDHLPMISRSDEFIRVMEEIIARNS